MAPGVATIMWKTVDGYKLSTGEHYSINDQVTFHNEGFADYFIDFSLDLQDYETIFVSMLGLTSFLSLFIHTGEDAFVGFARSALRGHRVWVCGLSIVPRFRGKGVGSILLREYLNLLRERSDVRIVQLEVIKQNARAFKLYQRFGFTSMLELRDYEIENVRSLPEVQNLTLSTSDQLDLTLPWLQQRTKYSWQRELSTLLNSSRGLQQYVIRGNGEELVVALSIETAKRPFRLTGFAFEKDALTSRDLAGAIRIAVGDASKGISIMFEPYTSEAIPLLAGIDGCVRDTRMEEYQMVLLLERNERNEQE